MRRDGWRRSFATFIITLLCAVFFSVAPANAGTLSVGTIIGEVLSTDIIAMIDQQPIHSLNINGYTAIVVEDLRQHGFDVKWNADSRTIQIVRNHNEGSSETFATTNSVVPGQKLHDVLYTDIRAFVNGVEVVSFNIDGRTAIFFNQLKPFGELQWNADARIASLDLTKTETDFSESSSGREDLPDSVTRHLTQRNPDDVQTFYQPLDRSALPDFIRVGLQFGDAAVTSVTVRGKSALVAGTFEKDSFHELMALNDSAVVQLKPDHSYYVKYSDVFQTASELLKSLANTTEHDDPVVLAWDGRGWNLLMGPFADRFHAEEYLVRTNTRNNGSVFSSQGKETLVTISNEPYSLYYSNNSPLYFSSGSDPNLSMIQIDNNLYRGTATARNQSDYRMTVINKLNVEHYLYGVVPKEMPSSWHEEALKAQAVAARGFALSNLNRYSQYGFDICTTVNSQVYGGYQNEKESTNRAVDQTSGRLITYQGKLAIPYYHSSSGGQTESTENIWSTSVPYAVGVDDPFSLDSPHANWTVTVTFPDIEAALRERQIFVGRVADVLIEEHSENGKVIGLRIDGTEGSHLLTKQEPRWVFGLRSNDFDITKVDNAVSFNGRGYGHGVGMSQYGAKSMAEAGYSWQDILRYYYSGIAIE